MKSLPLYVSRDHESDWLVALEFGRVLDGQPDDHFLPVDNNAAFVLDGPGGDVVGVWVDDLRDYDPAAPGSKALWRGPRFDIPLLGLRDAYAGELVLAAQASLLTESTINRCYFDMAVSEEPDEAVKVKLEKQPFCSIFSGLDFGARDGEGLDHGARPRARWSGECRHRRSHGDRRGAQRIAANAPEHLAGDTEMDWKKRMGRKPEWRVDEAATSAEVTQDPAPLDAPPSEGRVVFEDEDGNRRRLPEDLSRLSTE